jgi:hypothetical protein
MCQIACWGGGGGAKRDEEVPVSSEPPRLPQWSYKDN